MFRRRWLKRLLAIVGVFTAVAALPRLAFWWFSERLRDAHPTSVDTVMQEPEAWLGRLIQVEGDVEGLRRPASPQAGQRRCGGGHFGDHGPRLQSARAEEQPSPGMLAVEALDADGRHGSFS